MGFEGLVMPVSVRDFLFDGIKTGSSGWMIGMQMINGQPQLVDNVLKRGPFFVFIKLLRHAEQLIWKYHSSG